MSVTVVDAGERRALRPEELEILLRPHPPRVAAEARALFTGQEVTLRPDGVAASLKSALQQAARRVVPAALAEIEPAAARQVDPEVGLIAEITDLPVYQFVPPPAGLVSAEPVELGPAGATRTCSAFEEAPATILKRGNQALAALAALRYGIPDGDDREEKMDALARQITAVAVAARACPMMAVRPTARYLELAPGELPSVLSQTVEAFVRSLRPQEALDVPLINQVGRALGHPKRVPQVVPPLDRVAPFYTGIDEKLWLLGQQMADVRERLLNGEDAAWWLEGTRLGQGGAPTTGDLEKGAGDHLVIPGLGPRSAPPGPGPVPTPPAGAAPIVLTVSDLHLGQGIRDNAEEGYPELEAALVAMLDTWSDRVAEHRGRVGAAQPAYLVLNGDVLDFWSADMEQLAGAGDRFVLDVDNVGGDPRLTPAAAGRRMQRILDAHVPFFGRVTRWVDEDRLNFVVYVCGNHDDHLVRFGLGEALATALHPARGAFAAQSLYFPELCTIIEHGHRKDEFNAWQGEGTDIGVYGSLGEVLVSTMINPAERGGASALVSMQATFPPFIDDTGIDTAFLGRLGAIYNHFRRCYAVNEEVYEGCMGAVDNLDRGGLEVAVAGYTGRELVERDRDKADAADVSNLYDDLEDLSDIWLKSDLQTFTKKYLAPALRKFLSPSQQAWLVEKIFAGDHAGKLGFERGRGLDGNPQMRIHLVGHTHEPEATTPPIDGRTVFAQHVNTGTGQDTWTPDDDGREDDLDLALFFPLSVALTAVEHSEDELTPVAKSNYCLLQVAPVMLARPVFWRMYIEAGEFRTLQTHRPEGRKRAVAGGLMPRGRNTTILT